MSDTKRARWSRRKRRPGRPRLTLLPVLLTLGNLSFGVLAVLSVFQGHLHRACWFVLVGMVLDGLDGWAARTTRSTSAFGLQLDSLSDMVTFGVAPALVIYEWVFGAHPSVLLRPFGVAMTLFYCACVAIRLARFNLIPSESDRRYFIGLPSPGAAVMMVTSVLWFPPLPSPPVVGVLPLAGEGFLAVLMVSNIRYRSSKALEIHHRRPRVALASMALLIALIASYTRLTLFFGSLGYVCSGLAVYGYRRVKSRWRKPQVSPERTDEPVSQHPGA